MFTVLSVLYIFENPHTQMLNNQKNLFQLGKPKKWVTNLETIFATCCKLERSCIYALSMYKNVQVSFALTKYWNLENRLISIKKELIKDDIFIQWNTPFYTMEYYGIYSHVKEQYTEDIKI